MGNTGGDNRVEFDTMMEHSIWYESPTWNNMSFSGLFSPGQNRATNSSAIPQGSSNCAGGNIPGSGGLIGGGGSTLATNPTGGIAPDGCNDGGFSNAASASLVYDDKKAWYAVAAYELHQSVNRGSDLGIADPTDPSYIADTGNETAAKVGLMYRFDSTGTRIGGIFESMKRNIPSYLEYQNERQRNGTWVVVQQDLPGANQLNLGWARANAAVGDAAGQHNYNSAIPYSASTANMYTIAGIHQVDRNLSFYANYAMTVNNGNAHYDLGAGGHGITTDCHNSSISTPASGGLNSNPQCWGGTTLQGFSVGMRYRF